MAPVARREMQAPCVAGVSNRFLGFCTYLVVAVTRVSKGIVVLGEVSGLIGTVLRYPGSKWRLADWIVGHLTPHITYLEPFFGSGAVLFSKPRSQVETVNDINGDVVNLFRIIRERPEDLIRAVELTPWARAEYYASYEHTGDPLEDARRFLVRCWMSHGAKLSERAGWAHHIQGNRGKSISKQWVQLPERIALTAKRLQGVQIEQQDAVVLVKRYAHPSVLIYADPPYPLETRSKRKYYADEMTVEEHLRLLDALDAHPGPVLLSGYRCDMYDRRLAHWHRREARSISGHGQERTEVLWLNPLAAAGQFSLFTNECVAGGR